MCFVYLHPSNPFPPLFFLVIYCKRLGLLRLGVSIHNNNNNNNHTNSKDPDSHVLEGLMLAAKTHPACTIHEDGMWLSQWLDVKKTVTYSNISSKMENPRDIAGKSRRRRMPVTEKMCSLVATRQAIGILGECCDWLAQYQCTVIEWFSRFDLQNRLVGLVVKASASRVEDHRFKSRLRRDFSGVESYQWLKNGHSSGYPARCLAL